MGSERSRPRFIGCFGVEVEVDMVRHACLLRLGWQEVGATLLTLGLGFAAVPAFGAPLALEEIGVSPDGAHAAWVEFGIGVGSGLPFARVKMGALERPEAATQLAEVVAPTAEIDPRMLVQTALEGAAPTLQDRSIHRRHLGQRVVHRPLTELDADPHIARFATALRDAAEPHDTWTLRIAGDGGVQGECPRGRAERARAWLNDVPLMEGEARLVAPCAVGYRIHAIWTLSHDPRRLVVFVDGIVGATKSFGRFPLAFVLRLPEPAKRPMDSQDRVNTPPDPPSERRTQPPSDG